MMKNLSVRVKLFLMLLVMVVPFLGVLISSQNEYARTSIIPWENEIKGAKTLDPVYPYLVGTILKRSQANIAAQKYLGFESKVQDQVSSYGELLKCQDEWKAATDAIKGGRGEDAVAAMLKMVDEVGDKSSLILDPDLDSYWVMNSLVVNMPVLADHTGRLLELANKVGASRANAEQRQELWFALGAFKTDLDGVKFAYEKAASYNGDLNGKLNGLAEVLRVGGQIVEQGKVSAVSGDGLARLGEDSVDFLGKLPSLYSSANSALVELIQGRLSGDKTDKGNINRQREFYFLGLLGLVAAVIFSVFIATDLSRSLVRALASLQLLQNRDLRATELPDTNRGDEFGELFSAIESVRASLRAQIQSITTASRETNQAVAQLVSVTSQVSAAASETATSLAEASTTADEVKQTAVSAEQKAKNVAQSASEAAQVAMQGRQGAEKTHEDVLEIRSKMEQIAESILQLSAHGRAIGEIIVAVNDLAEQSNVLAVNASIEAAKAGEAGRGFSVVAQEVKSLADESKKSTMKVRAILADIEKSAASAIMVAEQGTKVAVAGLQQASDAGESIRALGGKVVSAAQAAAQIAASSAQQLAGVDQVVSALVSIRDGSVQVVGALQTLDTAAKKLRQESEALLATTTGFNL